MFNGAILVTKNDSIIYKESFGYAHEKTKEKITTESVFYIASVSKQFTAMGIMMLQEQGKLSYDDKIKDIFLDYPTYLKTVTIRQLLNHTSGLTDTEYYKLTEPSNKDVLETLMKQDSLGLENGKHFRYSNSGYVMLALIIQKISDKPIDQFFNQEIFEPLEMKNTTATNARIENISNKVAGYNLIGSKVDYESSVIGPGGIYSTLNDLEKWNKALNTNKLISQKTLKEAFKNGKLNENSISINMNDQEYGYGFGWMPYEKNGKKYVQHDGTVENYRSLIKKNLTDGYDYIFLTNQGGRLAMNELTTSIDNILENSKYIKPEIPIANKIVQEFEKNDTNKAITIIKNAISGNPSEYNIDENNINRLSYTYLRDGQMIKSIEVFKLNTELHPNSANAFDSLAEGYFANKQFGLSKENYRKSLELNPENENAKVMIERIGKITNGNNVYKK
ncbi:serine hydrolase [Zunongwangia endophytica]|nr:serine hydrolase [Zunongwangia endophytica]MDN3593474.1 serine hydrolase [Zunongwangia endophytica]